MTVQRITPEAMRALADVATLHGGPIQQPHVVDDGVVITAVWDGMLPHSRIKLFAGVTPSGATVVGEGVVEVTRETLALALFERERPLPAPHTPTRTPMQVVPD